MNNLLRGLKRGMIQRYEHLIPIFEYLKKNKVNQIEQVTIQKIDSEWIAIVLLEETYVKQHDASFLLYYRFNSDKTIKEKDGLSWWVPTGHNSSVEQWTFNSSEVLVLMDKDKPEITIDLNHGDLTLFHNLLVEDEKSYIESGYTHIAKDRRNMADRILNELTRVDKEVMEEIRKGGASC